jgi:hypothetical protein
MCYIYGNNLSYSSYLGEESVPDGEKIISFIIQFKYPSKVIFSNSENSIVAF